MINRRTLRVKVLQLLYSFYHQSIQSDDNLKLQLKISNELQLSRLKKEYPETWQNHISNSNHESEVEINLIDENEIDLVIDVDKNINQIFQIIENFLLNI